MQILLDTNLLLRSCNPNDPQHSLSLNALKELSDRNDLLYICPQNMVEFRAVATRPIAANGLGFTSLEADIAVKTYETEFPLLPDTAVVYPEWKSIVAGSQVLGKQVHDARLVAVAVSAGIDAILTFNTAHFTRLCAASGLQLLDPRTT